MRKNGKFYVRKELTDYNRAVYERLQQLDSSWFPHICEIAERRWKADRHRGIYQWSDAGRIYGSEPDIDNGADVVCHAGYMSGFETASRTDTACHSSGYQTVQYYFCLWMDSGK